MCNFSLHKNVSDIERKEKQKMNFPSLIYYLVSLGATKVYKTDVCKRSFSGTKHLPKTKKE